MVKSGSVSVEFDITVCASVDVEVWKDGTNMSVKMVEIAGYPVDLKDIPLGLRNFLWNAACEDAEDKMGDI